MKTEPRTADDSPVTAREALNSVLIVSVMLIVAAGVFIVRSRMVADENNRLRETQATKILNQETLLTEGQSPRNVKLTNYFGTKVDTKALPDFNFAPSLCPGSQITFDGHRASVGCILKNLKNEKFICTSRTQSKVGDKIYREVLNLNKRVQVEIGYVKSVSNLATIIELLPNVSVTNRFEANVIQQSRSPASKLEVFRLGCISGKTEGLICDEREMVWIKLQNGSVYCLECFRVKNYDDADIKYGDGGGPIFDENHQLVGLMASSSINDDFWFCVPIEKILAEHPEMRLSTD